MSKFFKNTLLLFAIIGIVKAIDTFQKLYISYKLGVTEASDVYWAMITIPDYILVVTGLDTINGVVNSEYSSLHSKGEFKKIFTSFSFVILWISLISIVIVAGTIFFKGAIVNVLFPGFNPYKQTTAVNIFSIILYIIFFKSISGYLTSTYNSLKIFYYPAVIPILLSICIFLFSLVPSNNFIENLAYGNLIGSFLIFLLLSIGFIKYREYLTFPKFRIDDTSRKIIYGCLATFLLVLSNQLFILSRNFFASYFGDGDLSSLNYATQITRLINLIVFLTIFNLSVNKLSYNFSTNKIIVSRLFFLKLVYGVSFVVLPIIIFFLCFADEITSFIYLRGNITSSDISKIVRPFLWETLSIFPYVIYTIIVTLFLAFKKYKLLTKIGVSVFLMGVLLTYFSTDIFGYYGVSVTQFVTAFAYAALLLYFSQYLIGGLGKEIKKIILFLFIGVLSFLVLFGMKYFIGINFNSETIALKLLYLISFFIFNCLSFLCLSFIFKVEFLNDFIYPAFIKRFKK